MIKNTIGIISPTETSDYETYLGSFKNIAELVQIFKIEELIFCSQDLPNQEIIASMVQLGQKIDYKILPQHSQSIIGSSSKNTSGELYTMDVQFKIASPMNRRNKRLLDIIFSTICLVFSPILVFFY